MAGQTRGRFLGTGAAAVGGAALAGMWRASGADAAAADDATFAEAPFGPAFSGDVFFLETAGADGSVKAGWVSEVDGGHAVADVVTEKLGGDHIAHKHIGNVKYEDLAVSSPVGGGKGVFDWIKATLDHQSAPVNGSILGAGTDGKQQSRGRFTEALITEIGFPALDAASKEAAYVTVKLSPETTTVSPASGKAPAVSKPKPVSFKLEIAGLDAKRVTSIDSFTIKQSIEAGSDGKLRVPGRLEYPNLTFYVPETDAQQWAEWFDDFVIAGNSGDDRERAGALVYFNPKEISVARIDFKNLGVFKVSPDTAQSPGARIRQVKVELYCEELHFDIGPGWAD